VLPAGHGERARQLRVQRALEQVQRGLRRMLLCRLRRRDHRRSQSVPASIFLGLTVIISLPVSGEYIMNALCLSHQILKFSLTWFECFFFSFSRPWIMQVSKHSTEMKGLDISWKNPWSRIDCRYLHVVASRFIPCFPDLICLTQITCPCSFFLFHKVLVLMYRSWIDPEQ